MISLNDMPSKISPMTWNVTPINGFHMGKTVRGTFAHTVVRHPSLKVPVHVASYWPSTLQVSLNPQPMELCQMIWTWFLNIMQHMILHQHDCYICMFLEQLSVKTRQQFNSLDVKKSFIIYVVWIYAQCMPAQGSHSSIKSLFNT